MAKISIITPVYNGEQYIPSFVKMLDQQSEKDFEVIIVDDASRDASLPLLEFYAQRHPFMNVFQHDRNINQGAARNTGLQNARGEYVCYVDVDDRIPQNYLEVLLASARHYDAEICVVDSVWEFPDRQEVRSATIPHTGNATVVSGATALANYFAIYSSDLAVPVEPWGKLIRKSLIDDHGLRFPECLFEDVIMTYIELALARKVVFLAQNLYYYNRKNTGSATYERAASYIEYIHNVPRFINNYCKLLNLYRALEDHLCHFHFRYIDGAYSFFASKADFRQQMERNVLQYRGELIHREHPSRPEKIARHLRGFASEMEHLGMSEMYPLLIDGHRHYLDSIFQAYDRR